METVWKQYGSSMETGFGWFGLQTTGRVVIAIVELRRQQNRDDGGKGHYDQRL